MAATPSPNNAARLRPETDHRRGTADPSPTFVRGGVCAGESVTMAKCITCGVRLHPERARKYNYCMARECQDKNAQGLTMVAVGMNKAADELLILDEHTRADLASGETHPLRRPCHPRLRPLRRPGGRSAGRSRPRHLIRHQPAAPGRRGRKGS